ncbi:hypothetical protein AAFN60_19120 [Roseibacillus persicicus]|uniref:hypothetical protein n=1 Tax=Roseibacillus persicicus TaxID=454148 RepID=UPI00398BA4F3
MNDLSTFEEIASLLPDERRERFLSMVARFQTVPEDDEYLQILEAIGFMTLLWKEVPGEIKAVLAGANPISETCESTANHIRDAVIEAIPSYEDLTQITKRLEAHELALKKTTTINAGRVSTNHSFPAISALIAFLLGGLALYLAQLHLFPYLP